MKKDFLYFTILFSVFSLNVTAQQKSEEEIKKILSPRVDSFLNVFMQASEFRKPGTEIFSDEVAQTYSSLFASDAKVYFEMAPALLDGDREYPFFLKFSSLKKYITKIKANYPAGLHQSLTQYAIDYSKINSGSFNIILEKVVTGISRDGYSFENKDTISLEIKTGPDFSAFKIERILNLGSQFRLTNDRDKDLVIDSKDKCPDEAGSLAYEGCSASLSTPVKPSPTSSRPSTFIALLFNYGISMKTTVDGPVKSDLGYAQIIDQTFRMSPVTADDSKAKQYGVTLQLEKFFGSKGIIGGGLGVSYQHFETELTMKEFFVEFHDIDTYGSDYRRVIFSTASITEKISMNSITIPLTIKFKKNLFAGGGVFADAGIAFSLLLSGSGKTNTPFNYEAIYKLDNTLATPRFIYDTTVTPGTTNWIVKEDYVNSLNGNNSDSTNSYFTRLINSGFDVAENKIVNKSSDFELNPSLALLFSAGMFFKLSKSIEADLGAIYMSESKNNDKKSGYKITDKSGDYSSMVHGSGKITNSSIGIRLGLRIPLK